MKFLRFLGPSPKPSLRYKGLLVNTPGRTSTGAHGWLVAGWSAWPGSTGSIGFALALSAHHLCIRLIGTPTDLPQSVLDFTKFLLGLPGN